MIKFNDFAERVRKAASLIGGQLELSRRSGISNKSINSYALGTAEPTRPRLLSLAEAANVSVGWLASGEGFMRPEEMQSAMMEESGQNHPPSEIKRMPEPEPCTVDAFDNVAIPQWKHPDPELFDYVPLVETQLSAGGGAYVASEDIESYCAFRKIWLSRIATSARNLVLMRVIGNSMSPKIQADDIVMVDMGRRSTEEGMVYALRLDSTVMIKRLALRPGGRILITSDNRLEFESYEADVKDLHIIGKIIFFSRTFTG